MTVVRRTALFSIFAAAGLVALKLGAGIAAGSLGLLAEAAHSATDLVAALLTFFAVRVGEQPADAEHPFGHGKAEHLAALAEGAVLLVASGFIMFEAITRLSSPGQHELSTTWFTFAVLGIVIVVDVTRATASHRVGEEHHSAALKSNALHFAGDLGGSVAVLIGLILAANGTPGADSVAALIVAVVVVFAAIRLMRENISVLMDTAPRGAEDKARAAIAELGSSVELRRLRMRQAGGKTFADVVVAVAPDAGLAAGHAVADDVEQAITDALGDGDVVVHVEPNEDAGSTRAIASAAALAVPEIREVHNVEVVRVGDRLELSLHIKLPRDLSLSDAHSAAERAEQEIKTAIPEIAEVHTHIEPLAEVFDGEEVTAEEAPQAMAALLAATAEVTGSAPVDVKLRRTGRGLVAMVTVQLQGDPTLATAHTAASHLEARAQELDPSLDEVVVHTEPAQPAA
jgi:cation diffusion facilitator family transporter